MSSEYIYTMYRVDKFFGPERQVLANISLSFFPGAKIGVLGPNGAGKSTVLRIMAGLEEPSSGVAELAPGASVGLLEQEPVLDPKRDVRGNVEDGVRALRDLLDRFNEISAAFAEPDADYDVLLTEQAKVRTRSIAPTRGSSTSRSTMRWTRFACPRATATSRRSPVVSGVASRSAACCSPRPIYCGSTSRRTTSTPSRLRGSSASSRT